MRYDNLDLERDIAIVKKANQLLDICRYPDGRWIPIHDAWARLDSRRVDPNVKPLEQSHATLLPGVGHAWLGRGKGEHQVQAASTLFGGLWACPCGQFELDAFCQRAGTTLRCRIYPYPISEAGQRSTLCHNTVLIDEKEQHTDRRDITDGSILAFEAAYAPVQWVEASGEDVYPELAEEYRRLVMLVNAGEEDHYVVDLFRVRGGEQRDWVMHGSADVDMRVEANVPLQHYGKNLLPGVKVRFPEHERDHGDAEGEMSRLHFFRMCCRTGGQRMRVSHFTGMLLLPCVFILWGWRKANFLWVTRLLYGAQTKMNRCSITFACPC